MAIESYRAARMQVDAESRSEFLPGIRIVLEIGRQIAGIAGLDFPALEKLSSDALQENANHNLAYFLESLAEDVERMGTKVDVFASSGAEERRALNELVSEAVARTAEAKSKDRVKRIARIVANALCSGPKLDYERERELIDTATQVAEADAHILGIMMKHQGSVVKNGGIADMNLANDTWRKMHLENREFREHRIHVSCARLQAQGLIIRMDRNNNALDLATNAYCITVYGVEFCEWCVRDVPNASSR